MSGKLRASFELAEGMDVNRFRFKPLFYLLLSALGAVAAACAGGGDAGGPAAVSAAPAVTPAAAARAAPDLPDLGPAPDFHNDVWLNTDGQTLRLADLRGKVVLVEFWTFGCINCQRVIPYMNEWQAKYAGDAFIIVSIHYPEFQYERDIENVKQAVARHEIAYAVGIDNERQTWAAYKQRYWPTRYLIDKNGHLRYMHIGEGRYDETAAAIEALMAEPYPVP